MSSAQIFYIWAKECLNTGKHHSESTFDLIWFGILVVVVTEISLITPPIGLNVFVLKGVLKDVPVTTIFKGVTPFWVADIFRLILLAGVPSIALFLPSMMN